MNNTGIHVYSEIGRLKKVMLHRPGQELENLMPEYLERLLFDDVPYLQVAQEEHDAFASILRGQGVEVVYLADLVEEAVSTEEIRAELIREYVAEAGERPESEKQALIEYYSQLGKKEMILQMMAGLRKSQLGGKSSYVDSAYPFAVDPMPNLYFTRDPFASIGNGVSIHKMRTVTRNRETLFAKFIFKYHPMYSNTPVWYDRTNEFSLEGGDILMLNEETVAVGISQRTDAKSAEILAERILGTTNYKQVLGFDIPKHRAFMHLDTVFTMVDYDKFTIHPNIMEDITVYVMEKGEDGKIKTTEETLSLEDILKKHLNLDKVTLIKCGGGDVIDAAREQWNDGSNTLAIAPGEVVVYSRNYVTNRILEENGIKTYVMPSAELSRGRGGPRCMSMPLWRERL